MGQPGHNRQSAERGKNDGDRDIGGHGRHIGPHHAGDKKQRGKTDDDGQGGHDHRRQHLVYRRQGSRCGFAATQQNVALDIIHIGDGIVHHEPQGQNQREQGDPIDGVPQKEIDKQGQGETDRHRQGHHHCFAPAQGDGQQDDDTNHRKRQRTEQAIDFLLGGVTVPHPV